MRLKSLTFERKPPKAYPRWCQWCGVLGNSMPDTFVGNGRPTVDCCVNCLPGPPDKLYYVVGGGTVTYLEALQPLS